MTAYRFDRRDFCTRALAAGASVFAPRMLCSAEPRTEVRHKEPLPFVDGSFTLALLPDTQLYSQDYPQHFYNQTRWIVDNAQKYNIQHVLHLGDITNRNNRRQWEVAQRAIQTLDGRVPYMLTTGNHDTGPRGSASTRDTLLNEYFPFKTHQKQPTFGGAMQPGRLENAWHTFKAGSHEYLLIALEWAPRDETVEWANQVVGQHRDHRAILITHAYMYFDDTRHDWKKFGDKQTGNPHATRTAKLPGGVNDGEDLWQKLVSKHPNFIMTFNGHVVHDGLGRLTSAGSARQPIHQMLVNYQMNKEGGEGFLRLVEFLPDDQTVQVKAYSPSLDLYRTDEQNQFVIKQV